MKRFDWYAALLGVVVGGFVMAIALGLFWGWVRPVGLSEKSYIPADFNNAYNSATPQPVNCPVCADSVKEWPQQVTVVTPETFLVSCRGVTRSFSTQADADEWAWERWC